MIKAKEGLQGKTRETRVALSRKQQDECKENVEERQREEQESTG